MHAQTQTYRDLCVVRDVCLEDMNILVHILQLEQSRQGGVTVANQPEDYVTRIFGLYIR